MSKIGKLKMFKGRYKLHQTVYIRKYLSSIPKGEKPDDYLMGKKPIMVDLHEEGMWITMDLFIISGGDVFSIE